MSDYTLKEDEYINESDGLVWRRKCNTPRQIRVTCGNYSVSPMVRCKCQQIEWDQEKERRRQEDLRRYADFLRKKGLGWKILRDYRFENDTCGYTDLMKYMANLAERFEEIPVSGYLLWGPHGTGKTFAAACVVNALIDRGIPAVMRSLSDMAGEMTALSPAGQQDYLAEVFANRFICIDDVNLEGDTPLALKMKKMIMEQWAKCGKPSILTTSYSLAELKDPSGELEEKIFGDLLDKCVLIGCHGPDLRKELGAKRTKEIREYLS